MFDLLDDCETQLERKGVVQGCAKRRLFQLKPWRRYQIRNSWNKSDSFAVRHSEERIMSIADWRPKKAQLADEEGQPRQAPTRLRPATTHPHSRTFTQTLTETPYCRSKLGDPGKDRLVFD